MCRAQMTIWAPTAEAATQELQGIAQETNQTIRVGSTYPQGHHNWLVTYYATAEAIRIMEEWVS